MRFILVLIISLSFNFQSHAKRELKKNNKLIEAQLKKMQERRAKMNAHREKLIGNSKTAPVNSIVPINSLTDENEKSK